MRGLRDGPPPQVAGATLRLAHTWELETQELDRARALMEDVFGEEMAADDWEHCLGGVHVLATDEGGALVGHAAVVQRRLLHGGRALRTGYVEGVAVARERKRRGLGRALMAALVPVLEGAYELGALATSEEALPFYAAVGWQLWRGPAFALTPEGTVRTADEDGGIYVLPGSAPLDLDGALTCDWRDGEVW